MNLIIVVISAIAVAKLYFEIDHYIFYSALEKMSLIESTTSISSLAVEEKKLQQEGYSIYYYPSGNKEQELLIFLHPAIGDHRCFDSQLKAFSQHYRVITVDLLGHGKSQAGKSKDKIDASARHLKEIMEREGYENASLVGVSLGALVAQDFASKYPERIKALVAVGGYDIHASEKELSAARRAQSKTIFHMLSRAMFSMKAFRKYIALNTVDSPEQQARIYEIAGSYTRGSFKVMPGLNKIIQAKENYTAPYPLLIINGDREKEAVAISLSESWHGRNKSSQFHIIEGAGHCANMDKPEEFNQLVLAFLEKQRELPLQQIVSAE